VTIVIAVLVFGLLFNLMLAVWSGDR